MRLRSTPVGAILAGGAGLRIGGEKATVELHGKPLICYPREAVGEVLKSVSILAKTDTKLPPLAGVTVWIEPERPRHPLVGITHALALSGGRPVLVCAADLPFVTPELVRRLVRAAPRRAPAVVACAAGTLQPLLGCYQSRALDLLAGAAREGTAPLRETIAMIDPIVIEADDPDELFDVDTPDDLLQAAAMLDRRRAATLPPY
ncbi:MAG: molybdenum cofactor guanylyltransferase [Solirubrobacterales bacterium]|nr:molybdenum cofactor guanylyltransferase [Solirubrobacterales bacterium]MBV9942208.1 molybdenum cofactor guanylyltransferase [Solirubrobacterales bacterium]